MVDSRASFVGGEGHHFRKIARMTKGLLGGGMIDSLVLAAEVPTNFYFNVALAVVFVLLMQVLLSSTQLTCNHAAQ